MLTILRRLTPDELREVVTLSGAHPGASQEEVVRYLARACGATSWLILPAQTPEKLLDHVSRRLGMPPLESSSRALAQRERAILAYFIRQAWEGTDLDRRRVVVERALSAWDDARLPAPPPPAGTEEAATRVTLENLLHHAAGCRGLATALHANPLPLPPTGWLRGALPSGSRVGSGQQVLYGVLLVLWRARGRLLAERRAQSAHLERQGRQLASLEEVRRRNATVPGPAWTQNPASGLALTAAAATSMVIQVGLGGAAGALLLSAAFAGAAGLTWATVVLLQRPGVGSDRRAAQMTAQRQSCRQELARVQREIREIEGEGD